MARCVQNTTGLTAGLLICIVASILQAYSIEGIYCAPAGNNGTIPKSREGSPNLMATSPGEAVNVEITKEKRIQIRLWV